MTIYLVFAQVILFAQKGAPLHELETGDYFAKFPKQIYAKKDSKVLRLLTLILQLL